MKTQDQVLADFAAKDPFEFASYKRIYDAFCLRARNHSVSAHGLDGKVESRHLAIDHGTIGELLRDENTPVLIATPHVGSWTIDTMCLGHAYTTLTGRNMRVISDWKDFLIPASFMGMGIDVGKAGALPIDLGVDSISHDNPLITFMRSNREDALIMTNGQYRADPGHRYAFRNQFFEVGYHTARPIVFAYVDGLDDLWGLSPPNAFTRACYGLFQRFSGLPDLETDYSLPKNIPWTIANLIGVDLYTSSPVSKGLRKVLPNPKVQVRFHPVVDAITEEDVQDNYQSARQRFSGYLRDLQ